MNHDNNTEKDLTAAIPSQTAINAAPKRSYTKREKKAPTIASFNEQIESKHLEIKAIQAEIEDLTVQRNELYISESAGLGLMEIVADPEKAKLLARFLAESNQKQNQ